MPKKRVLKNPDVTYAGKHVRPTVTAEDVIRVENKRKAVALRGAGATYEVIAETLGLANAGAASMLVREAYAELRATCLEETQLIVEMECYRLDEIQMSHWQKRGDPRHADTLLRVMERRARMLGLDKPEKKEITGADGESLVGDDLIERIMGKLFGGTAQAGSATSEAGSSKPDA